MGTFSPEFSKLIADLLGGARVLDSDNDVVLIGELGGDGGSVSIDLGAGNNFLEFTDFRNGEGDERIDVSAGSGDDVIYGYIGADWTGSGSDLSLNLGAGNSSISLRDAGISGLSDPAETIATKGAVISRLEVTAGLGDHDIYVENAISDLGLDLAAGDHILFLGGHVQIGSITLGSGHSAVALDGFQDLSLTKADGDLLFSSGEASGDLTILAGNGNHTIHHAETGGAIDIDLGDGDHRIRLGEIDEGFRHINSLRVGDGNSQISFDDFLQDETGSRGRNEIIAGNGNHVIDANLGHGSRHPGLVMSYKAEVGEGSSTIVFDGSNNPNGRDVRVNAVDVDAGGGSHSVLINAHARNATVDLIGAGDDLVIYDSGIVGRTLSINTHGDNDVVLIDGAGRQTGGEGYQIDTGAGMDTVIVYNVSTSGSAVADGAPLGMTVRNAETVMYADTDLAETLADLGLTLPVAEEIKTNDDLQIEVDASGYRPSATLTSHISGRVFAENTGALGFDDADYGLGYSTVVLLQDGLRIDEVRTNLDGTYRFDGVELGDYSVAVLPLSGGRFIDSTGMTGVSVSRDSAGIADFGVQFHARPTQISTFEGTSLAADFDTMLRFCADAEAFGLVSYSLEGVDADLFRIDPLTGVLSFVAGNVPSIESPIDADGDNVYDVTVVRSGGAFLELPREVVEISVLDSQSQPLGQIKGRYFDDVKGTGREVGGNGDAPGIADAVVVLMHSNGALYQNARGERIMAVTDEFGRYTLTDVPAGDYKVGFERFADRDFVRQGRDRNDNGRSDNRKDSDVNPDGPFISALVTAEDSEAARSISLGVTRTFTVDAGEFVSDVDAGAVSNARYGSIISEFLSGTAGTDRLFGLAGDDTLDGGAGDDVLDGNEGDDVLTGGAGQDAFIFRINEGSTTITDFQLGFDFLDIEGFASVSNDDDLLAIARQEGSSTVFEFGDDLLVLMNTNLEELRAGDLCVY